MASTVNSTLLLQAVKSVKNSLSLSNSSSFDLSCEGGKVHISGGSKLALVTDAAMKIGIPAINCTEDWTASVNVKILMEAVKCFPKDIPISLLPDSDEEGKLLLALQSCSGKTKVATCDPLPYIVPGLPEPKLREISSEIFSKIVQVAGFAASTDEAKQCLTGIRFDFLEELLEVTATDGHRLSELSLHSEGGDNGSFTVVAKPLQEIASLIKKAKSANPVKAMFQDDGKVQIIAKPGDLTIFYNQGPTTVYPNTKQLFPDKFKESFTVGQKELLKELENVSKVVKDYNNTVILNVSEGFLHLRSHAPANEDGPSYANTVPCDAEEEGLQIGFNVRYLTECLKLPMFKGGTVRFNITSPRTPAVLTLEGCDSYRYLVMPVQIRS